MKNLKSASERVNKLYTKEELELMREYRKRYEEQYPSDWNHRCPIFEAEQRMVARLERRGIL